MEPPVSGRFRYECLNERSFMTTAHARTLIEEWSIEYNTARPHSSLGNLAPEQFARLRLQWEPAADE